MRSFSARVAALGLLPLALAHAPGVKAAEASEVNVYSYRQPYLITPLFKASRTQTVGQGGGGGHWGADNKLHKSIFRGPVPDPLHQRVTVREAALECLLPIAARRSIEQQRTVFIEELVKI